MLGPQVGGGAGRTDRPEGGPGQIVPPPRSWLEQGTDPAGGKLGDRSPPTWPGTDRGQVTSDTPGRDFGQVT